MIGTAHRAKGIAREDSYDPCCWWRCRQIGRLFFFFLPHKRSCDPCHESCEDPCFQLRIHPYFYRRLILHSPSVGTPPKFFVCERRILGTEKKSLQTNGNLVELFLSTLQVGRSTYSPHPKRFLELDGCRLGAMCWRLHPEVRRLAIECLSKFGPPLPKWLWIKNWFPNPREI